MDFFKGLFGFNASPASSPTTKGGNGKPSKVGPCAHPNHPNIAFASLLLPPSPSSPSPSCFFFLWDNGIPLYYRFQSKKQGEKTGEQLHALLSNPSTWHPSQTSTHPITSVSLLMNASSSSSASNSTDTTPKTPEKRVEIKLSPIPPHDEASNTQHSPLHTFPDMTNAYLDRLNKLLLMTDKKVKTSSEYSEGVHASLFACLVEATRLMYLIFHDSTLEDGHKRMRFKVLNEWVTRVLLTLDAITMPMFKVEKKKEHKEELTSEDAEEEEEFEVDEKVRRRRKSLINLALGIGTALSTLITPPSTTTQPSWEQLYDAQKVNTLMEMASLRYFKRTEDEEQQQAATQAQSHSSQAPL